MTQPPAADAALDVVRTAFGRYAAGDVPGMPELVAGDLSWTCLNPADPTRARRPATAAKSLPRRWPAWPNAARTRCGSSELTPGTGGTVLAVIHMPGRDERTAYRTGDRAYQVITVREGRIAGLRDCRTRDEARAIAGLG